MAEITALLAAAREGDPAAAGEAFGQLYPDLRRLARARLRQHAALTLGTTSLVHESYLKLIGPRALPIEDQRHFLFYASRVMRSVIIDCARASQAQRRGNGFEHVVLDTALQDELRSPEEEVLGVHEALELLAVAEPELAQVVEMRYFSGLAEAEIASAMQISERTVRRHWAKARLLLAEALQ